MESGTPGGHGKHKCPGLSSPQRHRCHLTQHGMCRHQSIDGKLNRDLKMDGS